MIEIMLLFVLVLVFYNSKLWQRGEWEVNKTKFILWKQSRKVK